jgi:hypothetical protein
METTSVVVTLRKLGRLRLNESTLDPTAGSRGWHI